MDESKNKKTDYVSLTLYVSLIVILGKVGETLFGPIINSQMGIFSLGELIGAAIGGGIGALLAFIIVKYILKKSITN
ncbi:MAG: hypothetical protein Q7R70_00145 [Candidatus Diapherotrites archaeon]|nr:hypothetical protein [Candidatus Diapherotrites archaeon]